LHAFEFFILLHNSHYFSQACSQPGMRKGINAGGQQESGSEASIRRKHGKRSGAPSARRFLRFFNKSNAFFSISTLKLG